MTDLDVSARFDALRAYVDEVVALPDALPARRSARAARRRVLLPAAAAVVVAVVAVSVALGIRASSDRAPATPHPGSATARQLAAGHWTVLASPPRPLCAGVSVWTGTEMLIWAGSGPGDRPCDYGMAYAPGTGTWRMLPPAPIAAVSFATAVWTGKEFVVFGGYTDAEGKDSTAAAAAYDPASNSWRRLPAFPLGPEIYGDAVWDGHDVLVIGERTAASTTGPSALLAYDPAGNTWRRLADAPIDVTALGFQPSVAEADGRMLVSTLEAVSSSGKTIMAAPVQLIYTSRTNTWSVSTHAPARSVSTPLVTTSGEIIGPAADDQPVCVTCLGPNLPPKPVRLIRYRPATDTATPIASPPPTHVLAWTGAALASIDNATTVTKATRPSATPVSTAKNYAWDPVTDEWLRLPDSPYLYAYTPAVWTGHELLVLGRLLADETEQAPPTYISGGGLALTPGAS